MVDANIKAPLVGANFSGPMTNEPRTKPLQRNEPQEEEEELESTPEKVPEAKSYQENLEEMGISVDQAREIMDQMVFSNSYTHNVRIGKLRVSLRTRAYQDLQRLLAALESDVPTFPVHTDDMVARYNVAASLSAYGDHKFDFPDVLTAKASEMDNAFAKRMNFLMSLPTTIINRLVHETGKFDRLVEAVFAEGAPEDF